MRKVTDLDAKEGREALAGTEEGETIIRIYCIKILFSIKNNKVLSLRELKKDVKINYYFLRPTANCR